MPSIWLMRHAERLSGSSSISSHGRQQSLQTAKHLQSSGPLPSRLWASPKERCKNTVSLISEQLGLGFEVEPSIDERGPKETGANFDRRIKMALQKISGSGQLLICSHGDWLQVAMALMDTDASADDIERAWSFAEVRRFEVTSQGLWQLVDVFIPN